MLTLACTPEVIEALRHERFHHPHPHVLMKDGEALCEKPGTAGGTHPAVMCDRQSDILSLPPSVPHRRACATPRGPCRVSGEGPASVSRAAGSFLGRASTSDGRPILGLNGRSDQQQQWWWHAIDHRPGQIVAYVLEAREDEVFVERKTL